MFQALQAPLLTRDFGQISGLKELFTGEQDILVLESLGISGTVWLVLLQALQAPLLTRDFGQISGLKGLVQVAFWCH